MKFLALLAAAIASANGIPPSTPSGLTATQGNCLCADLAWNASTDDDHTTSQIIYRINRDGTDVHQQTGTTSYEDTGLTANQTYTYKVNALDPDGPASPYSSSVQITIRNGCN